MAAGPHVIKPGIRSLAQQSGAAVCLTCAFYENTWAFNSGDQFMTPKPFSKGVIRFGPLELIPQDMDSAGFEEVSLCIERKMMEGHEMGTASS
ncbi:MAG: hypothetical protein JRD69_07455 [Deltaproteobacteria bacterium]|nr:hypothetical protein [Deltaproteobacteria bacterium]